PLGCAEPHKLGGVKRIYALAIEENGAMSDAATLKAEQTANGTQDSRFASAIRAEQRDDSPIRHVDRDAAHGDDGALVADFDVLDGEHTISSAHSALRKGGWLEWATGTSQTKPQQGDICPRRDLPRLTPLRLKCPQL